MQEMAPNTGLYNPEGEQEMNVIFLGPPGAGKGTVAAVVKEEFSLEHISTGDMLRSEIKAGTALGLSAKEFIDAGKLVPTSVIIDMVAGRLAQAHAGLLFDGFPRTVEQAVALEGIADIDVVVELDVPEDVVVERICSRRVCAECGKVYSTLTYDGETCEGCGAPLVVRADDCEVTARKRFTVYKEETEPLSTYYESRGLLKKVDGTLPMEEVRANVVALFKEIAK